jgi:hypothetical protein
MVRSPRSFCDVITLPANPIQRIVSRGSKQRLSAPEHPNSDLLSQSASAADQTRRNLFTLSRRFPNSTGFIEQITFAHIGKIERWVDPPETIIMLNCAVRPGAFTAFFKNLFSL